MKNPSIETVEAAAEAWDDVYDGVANNKLAAMQHALESVGTFSRSNCATRQASSRQTRTRAGGKLAQVMLTPKASTKLSAWQAKGETAAGVISRLLERSRP